MTYETVTMHGIPEALYRDVPESVNIALTQCWANDLRIHDNPREGKWILVGQHDGLQYQTAGLWVFGWYPIANIPRQIAAGDDLFGIVAGADKALVHDDVQTASKMRHDDIVQSEADREAEFDRQFEEAYAQRDRDIDNVLNGRVIVGGTGVPSKPRPPLIVPAGAR